MNVRGGAVARSTNEATAAAIEAALAPYAWRAFTDGMLARRAVAAVDQHVVASFLSTVAGAELGVSDSPEPADPDDERVSVLVRTLTGRRWHRLCLDRLCADLASSLAAWQVERDVFHLASGRPLADS